MITQPVAFLSCPLVKKHADLSGSLLYSQSVMKEMYSKPTNRTELSIPMKIKALRSHSIYIYTNRRTFGIGNNQNVPEKLDLESSCTFKIYSDYACLKVSRETLRTIDSFLEQSRSVKSNNSKKQSLQHNRSRIYSQVYFVVVVVAASI